MIASGCAVIAAGQNGGGKVNEGLFRATGPLLEPVVYNDPRPAFEFQSQQDRWWEKSTIGEPPNMPCGASEEPSHI
jgi:hypothetical protein